MVPNLMRVASVVVLLRQEIEATFAPQLKENCDCVGGLWRQASLVVVSKKFGFFVGVRHPVDGFGDPCYGDVVSCEESVP